MFKADVHARRFFGRHMIIWEVLTDYDVLYRALEHKPVTARIERAWASGLVNSAPYFMTISLTPVTPGPPFSNAPILWGRYRIEFRRDGMMDRRPAWLVLEG